MLLSLIRADHGRFQCRSAPWSQRSVDAMLEKFDPAMFDPIPVVADGARWVVAGDGHSRFQAVSLLASQDRLPPEWRDGDDWDVPVREIAADDAFRLAYVANMGHEPFTPAEEARIFQKRLDAGETIEDVAASSHRSSGYVRKRLTLNCLCHAIREAVGQPWGLDVDKAIVLAECCQKYEIAHGVQSDLWARIISKGDWTQASMRAFMERFGRSYRESAASQGDGVDLLFALPPNTDQVVREVTSIAEDRRRVLRGLQWLVQGQKALTDFPELLSLVAAYGDEWIERAKQLQQEDADVLHGGAGGINSPLLGKLEKCVFPTETMLFLDSEPRNAWNDQLYTVWHDPNEEVFKLSEYYDKVLGMRSLNPPSNQFDFNRHNGTMNVGHADGHISTVTNNETGWDEVVVFRRNRGGADRYTQSGDDTPH